MFYLLCYDISKDTQRQKILKFLKDHGYHMQKSVFVLECKQPAKAAEIYRQVKQRTGQGDSLLMVPLCRQCLQQLRRDGPQPDFAQAVWIF